MNSKGIALVALTAITICISASFAASGDEAKPAAKPLIKVTFKITELGPAMPDPKDALLEVIANPDGKHYAGVSQSMDRNEFSIIVDGKIVKKFPDIFSVNLGGRIIRECAGIPLVSYSHDFKHLAYTGGVDKDKTLLVVDGKETNIDGSIDIIIYSPDSARFAYFVTSGKKHYVVVDGKKGKEYDGSVYSIMPIAEGDPGTKRGDWIPFFSPDSKHYAYQAQAKDKWLVVYDDKEGKQYDKIFLRGNRTFSPDSLHFNYLAFTGEKRVLVMDNIEKGNYDEGTFFNKNTQDIFRFEKKESGKCVVIYGGTPGKEYDEITSLAISPDSKHLAYVGRSGRDYFMVINGAEGKKYSNPVDYMQYSADSRHLAFTSGNLLVIDGNEKEYPCNVGNPVFSEDMKHFYSLTMFFEDSKTPHYKVMIDGVEGPPLAPIDDYNGTMYFKPIYKLVFGPDPKYVVYHTRKNMKPTETDNQDNLIPVIVVNTLGTDTMIKPWTLPVFDSPRKFHYIGTKDGKVYLVEVEITEIV